MNLVPQAVLARAEYSFDSIPGLADKYKSQLDDPLIGRAFKNYILLTEQPGLFAAQEFTAKQLFWSRYYWLVYVTRLESLTKGEDAGSEQCLFKFIEYSPYGWDVYQEVHEAAERAAKEHLRATRLG